MPLLRTVTLSLASIMMLTIAACPSAGQPPTDEHAAAHKPRVALVQDCAAGFRKITTATVGEICTLDLASACPTYTRYLSGAWNGQRTVMYRCEVPASMQGSIEQDPEFNPTCPFGTTMPDGASGVVCTTPTPVQCAEKDGFVRAVGNGRTPRSVLVYNCDGRALKMPFDMPRHGDH